MEVGLKFSPEPVIDKDVELILQSFKNLMIASGKITGKVLFRLLNMSFNQTAESIFKSGSNIASTILRDAPSYLAVSAENDVTAGDSALTHRKFDRQLREGFQGCI